MRVGIIVIAAIIVLFIANCLVNVLRRKNQQIIEEKLKQNEKIIKRNIDFDEWSRISYFCNKQECKVDHITSNDLELASIFARLNYCVSPLGEEYLTYLLHNPISDKAELVRRERIINFFENNDEKRIFVKKLFSSIQKNKFEGIFEYVDILFDAPKKSIVHHYICMVDIVISIIITNFNTTAGLIALIASVLFNIGTYFLDKGYFDCYTYPISIIEDVVNFDYTIPTELEGLIGSGKLMLGEEAVALRKIFKHARIVYSKNFMSGDLTELFLDNIRMLTHIDIIFFNHQIKHIKGHQEEVLEIMYKLGYLESLVSIATFRKTLEYYCVPQFIDNPNDIHVENVYHPLIQEPVDNSIHIKNSILLTGSNASGKSTFLKTLAINQVLAQTVCTCTAKKYQTSFYYVISSMALRDSIDRNESYYIAEIKAIKRIMDLQEGKIFCFIDEILRGTNTVERIASAAHILRCLKEDNKLCIAATHDIELTYMLEELYDNYHFCEACVDDEIKFDYMLKEGRNTNKNAIKLLGFMGMDSKVIEGAEKTAKYFEETSQWTISL